ncbi:MAG: hypothetical protein ACMXYM_00555 [Candidatus Woesearchaeota archaeon]
MIRWFGVVLLVVVSGCAIDLDAKAASGELFACTVDADCVAVVEKCFCNNGGLIAINQKYESAWLDRRDSDCEGLGTTMNAPAHVSCYSDGRCVDESCVLVPNAYELCSVYHYPCVYQDFEHRSSYEMYGIDCEDVFEICSAYDEERYGWRTPR